MHMNANSPMGRIFGDISFLNRSFHSNCFVNEGGFFLHWGVSIPQNVPYFFIVVTDQLIVLNLNEMGLSKIEG